MQTIWIASGLYIFRKIHKLCLTSKILAWKSIIRVGKKIVIIYNTAFKQNIIEIQYSLFNIWWNSLRFCVSRYDFLEVRDGNNQTSPMIGGKLCGLALPLPIISSGNKLFVHFSSDASDAKTGFQILVLILPGNTVYTLQSYVRIVLLKIYVHV